MLVFLNLALALTPADLAGTWNAVATWKGDNTCGTASFASGATSAYQWLVSTDPGGTFAIDVQGQTSFPRFTGRISASGGIVAASYGAATKDDAGTHLVPNTTMLLALVDGALSGVRFVQSWRPVPGLFTNPLLVAQTPCGESGSIVARR